MSDVCAGVVQDLLARMHGVEGCVLFWGMRRNAVHLLAIEDRVYAVDEPRFPSAGIVAVGCACIAKSVGWRWLRLVRSFFGLPVFDLSTLLATADLPSVVRCLLVCHPSGVLIVALKTRRHQVDRVASAIGPFAGGIERDAERAGSGRPWFLPGSDATFQHLNDIVRNFLAEITERWFVRWSVLGRLSSGGGHHRYSCPASSVIEKPAS